MPTVFLLDCSLSMLQTTSVDEAAYQRRHLAIEGLQTIIRHMGAHFQMEFSALLAFSSSVEPLVSWTRDYTSIESRLAVPIAMGDRTDLARAIQYAIDYVVAEWGTVSPPCQIVVVTDSPSIDAATTDFAIPFPCKLHVLLLASPDEVESIEKTSARLCNPLGSLFIHCPNGALSFQSSSDMFRRLVDAHFVPFSGELCCGALKSKICLIPPPIKFRPGTWRDQYACAISSNKDTDEFPQKIEICGFLPISEFSGPPCMSRHLVLDDPSLAQRIKIDEKPLETAVAMESGRKSNPSSANVGGTRGLGIKQERPDSSGLIGSEKIDYGKSPSFRILLHGSLKVENMAALAKLGEGWFGVLYSAADTRKKANLMLSVFPPNATISWLGDLNQLGCVSAEPATVAATTTAKPFPVPEEYCLSYHADPGVTWIRQQVLQLDVQKVLRYARKLPDKQQAFFKDVNKLRRSALSYGFSDLLTSIGNQLRQDAESIRHSHAAESALLIHVAKQLKTNRDPAYEIGPP